MGIISSILQDRRQKKKWLDHNFTVVISAHSNKRTSHSKITDLESNAFPIHLKVCLQSSTTWILMPSNLFISYDYSAFFIFHYFSNYLFCSRQDDFLALF